MEMQTAAPTTLRIRSINGLVWVLFVENLGLCAVSVGVMVAGALQGHGAAPFFTGMVLSIVCVPLTLVFFTVFRPVVVDAQSVRIPYGFRTRSIKTTEVAGVGLVYRWTEGSRLPRAWVLEFTDVQGQRYSVGRIFLASHTLPTPAGQQRPRAQFLSTRPDDWPVPSEDSKVLRQSRPGQVAATIYDFILRVQGENGPLARLAFQKEPPSQSRWAVSKTLAWWSPDGEMGKVSSVS